MSNIPVTSLILNSCLEFTLDDIMCSLVLTYSLCFCGSWNWAGCIWWQHAQGHAKMNETFQVPVNLAGVLSDCRTDWDIHELSDILLLIFPVGVDFIKTGTWLLLHVVVMWHCWYWLEHKLRGCTGDLFDSPKVAYYIIHQTSQTFITVITKGWDGIVWDVFAIDFSWFPVFRMFQG